MLSRSGLFVWVLVVLLVSGLSFFGGVKWGGASSQPESAGPANRPARAGRAVPASFPASAPSTPGLPADFEPQSAIILGGNQLIAYQPRTFQAIVSALQGKVPVVVLVGTARELANGQRLLERVRLSPSAVQFIVMPMDSMWVRDYGPIFLRRPDGSPLVLNAEYEHVVSVERPDDNNVPHRLAEMLGLPVVDVPLSIEGGNLLSNGDGLVVTSTAVRAKNQQRGYDLQAVGEVIGKFFLARQWSCLNCPPEEPTQHVDMCLTFVASNIVVVGELDRSEDPLNAEVLDQMAKMLAGLPTSRGPLQVHRIPMPPHQGELWRSYTNVIFANGRLLVPSYSDAEPELEQQAMDLYSRLLPGWEIVPIEADALVRTRGLLHCVSLNVPQMVPASRFRWNVPVFLGIEPPSPTARPSRRPALSLPAPASAPASLPAP